MLEQAQSSPTGRSGYYDGPELIDPVVNAARAAGLDPERLGLDDLASLDEFHALGRPATVALADLARIEPGSRVLDLGAGIGGPARVLASRYGAHVTAFDATARFCRLNQHLCNVTGLAEQVHVVTGDALALPFADASFDLAWTQALVQNIADKGRLCAEMHRVLVPGGRVAMFEVVAGRGGPLHFPVPWADDESESSLVAPAELREILVTAGFDIQIWNEGPAVPAEIQRAASKLAPPPDNGLALALLIPDYQGRMAGLARNVVEQRIGLLQAVATSSHRLGQRDHQLARSDSR